MSVSLYGGPLDGYLGQGLSHLPVYMVASNHAGMPVYKKLCCGRCTDSGKPVSYAFIGYAGGSAGAEILAESICTDNTYRDP